MNPKPDRFLPALYGGLITAGISAIPGLNLLNCFCCAGILLGGFLAVFFYRQELTPDMEPLTSNDCIRLGLLTGLVAAVAGTVISLAVRLTFGNVAGEIMLRILNRMNVEFPPEFFDMIREAIEEGISIVGTFITFLFSLVVDSIFCWLGAMIAWAAFKPKTGS